jgi:hypothetical protein
MIASFRKMISRIETSIAWISSISARSVGMRAASAGCASYAIGGRASFDESPSSV